MQLKWEIVPVSLVLGDLSNIKLYNQIILICSGGLFCQEDQRKWQGQGK